MPLEPGSSASVDLQVGAAEAALRSLGMRQVRVRHHGEVARIETDEDGMTVAFAPENRRVQFRGG